jgi:hypothetical protein
MTDLPAPIKTLSVTNIPYTTYSEAMPISAANVGIGVQAAWTLAAPAAVSFDSGLYAAGSVGDLDFTEVEIGIRSPLYTIEFVGDGTSGAETISILGSGIQVHMDPTAVTGSTATMIKTAWDADATALGIMTVAIAAGQDAVVQTIHAATTIMGGANNDFTLKTEPNPNQITILAHGLSTGNKVALTTGGTEPGGLPAGTYFAIYISASVIKLASSLANALAGTALEITSSGVGTHTLTAFAAAGGTVKIYWSIDDVTYSEVPAGFGGATVTLTTSTDYLYTVNNIQANYFKLLYTLTGGTLNSSIKWSSK